MNLFLRQKKLCFYRCEAVFRRESRSITQFSPDADLTFQFSFNTYAEDFDNKLRKIASIFLLFLLLFNALGFYGLYVGLRYKTSVELAQYLDDQQYGDEETVTLKVPLVLPYRIDLAEYQRVDGEVEYEGEFYQLVKQKLDNDTLYIVCYKDKNSKRIKQVLADYVKTFTDKPVDAKHQPKFSAGFIKDFLPSKLTVQSLEEGWNLPITFTDRQQETYNNLLAIDSPPPKV